MSEVAVVTGAGAGLGAVIAELLADVGFIVVVNTRRNLTEADAVVERIRTRGGRAEAVKADVTCEDEVAAMFERVRELGDLRVLVNNASLRRVQAVDDITSSDFREVLDVTLDGAFVCVRHSLPLLGAGSRIINVLGANAINGDARRVHVSAAKHGLLGLTLALAEALGPRGVTVNAVSPGIQADDAAGLRASQRRVASVVSLLASVEAAGVTGAVLKVEDGRPVTLPTV